MKTLLYERFINFSLQRIIFFGIMGIILLAIPSFVLNGAFYAVVGYLILAGILRLVGFICNKGEKHLSDYVGVALSAILFLFGIGGVIFSRYLVNLSPLYLGALILIEGVYYFSFSLLDLGGLRRSFLVLLSMIVFLGGVAVIIFTLGFGTDGLSGLGKVSGVASILSCVYGLAAYLLYKKNAVQHSESEERI